jgi:PAS domain S-box-containing protein
VKESQETRRRKPREQAPARQTIGLLLDETIEPVSWAVWLGVDDVARERGANVICFVGRALHAPGLSQASALYDLVSPENLDGLVIWGGGLAQYTDPEEIRILCEQYRPLPMVNAALPLEGIPSVTVDNFQGMRDVIVHLIEVHGYRRIAFIRGPEGHSEAEDRYRAYVSTLAEYGLPLDPDLIAPGEFSTSSGMAAIGLLLDQRKTDFEAVVGVDDATAIGATEELQARGIHVPGDVAVVGFDNEEDSWYVTPPLTTVALLGYEQGRRATEMVLALLQGEEVPEQVILPTEVVVRQSCGCLAPEVVQAATGVITKTTSETFEIAFAARREHILSEMAQVRGAFGKGLDPGWAVQLLDAFAAELGGSSTGAFLAVLDDVLRQTVADGMLWQGALSVLRRHALSCLSDDKLLTRAEDLWQQARVMIGGAAERARAYQASQAQRQAETLRAVSQSLIAMAGRAELMNIMAQELPRLGIPSCYVSLYEPGPELAEGDPQSPAEWSRLMLAYGERGRVALEAGGQRFPSRQLVPDGLLPRDRAYSMIVEPLYFREDQLGFALLEMGPREGIVYETLREQLSGGLWALLAQQMESRALRLQTASEVSRTASSILDPDELIQRVVDLVRERFDLYYAGLFLVDETGEWTGEPGKWAVLRAGTGDAGRQMLERKHKLEIGGTSMIGWCVANQRARIALDVGEEAVRFENPFLPETRSELALPLVSRGQAIGALTIQSAQEAAFSDEDIAVLQTMADQLANATQSARLFEKERQTALLLDRRVKDLNFLNDIGRKMEELPPIPEFLQWLTERIPAAMQYPDACRVAIEFEGHVYGVAEAPKLPRQMVRSLRLGGDFAGRVCIAYSKDYDFLNEESALLGDIVRRMSGYIENQRLLAETQETAQRMQALYETSRALSTATDEETAIRTVLESIYWAMGCDYLTIAIVDEQAGVIEDRHGIWHGEFDVFPEWVQLVRYPLDHPDISADIYRTGRTEIIEGWDERFNREIWEKFGHENLLRIFMPVRARDRTIGVIEVGYDRRKKDRIDKEEVQTLAAFVDQAAVALENARLIRETQQAARRLGEERSLLRTLIDNLPDYVYVKDKESRFLIGNSTQLRLMGAANQEEIVGKTDFDFFPAELTAQYYADEQEIMRSGQPLIDREERIQDQATGQYKWDLTTKVPLRDSSGVVTGLVGISRDITERKETEAKLQRRALQLQAAAEVARDATTARDLDELLNRAVNLVRDRFGFYHAGIFLVDEQGEYAILTAASGQAGQAMLEHAYKLKAGETGIVGYVTSRGQPRIALDVGTDAVHFKNPYLPDTRSELALPLKAGGQVIGALDVQSQQPAAFDEEDVQVLQIVADQLAVAIQNLRLLRDMQQTVRELEVAYGRYTRRSWSAFAQGSNRPYGYRYRRLGIEPAVEQSAEAHEALQRGQPVVATFRPDNPAASSAAQDNGQTVTSSLAVPIKLRGQTVGVLNLRFEEETVAQETISMVEEIAERLALVLENARLMQEAQSLVSREQRINLISSQVRSSISLDTILQNTVRELGRALGASRTFIQLGIEPDNPPSVADTATAEPHVQDEPHSPS